MSKTHIGAFLEIIAPPIIQKRGKYLCPNCRDERKSSMKFCPDCGTELRLLDVKEGYSVSLYGLLEIEDQYEKFVDVLSQVDIPPGPKGKIYLIGNRHYPGNPDSFPRDLYVIEIFPEIGQEMTRAFALNYHEILTYFSSLKAKGYITSIELKFGCLEYI